MITRRSFRGIGRRTATGLIMTLMLLAAPLTTRTALADPASDIVPVVDGGSLTTSDTTQAAGVFNLWFKTPPGCTFAWILNVEDHLGRFPCGTSVVRATWPDGHREFFGIGTDWKVYHIAEVTNGWKSMGGTATDPYQAYINGDGHATIAVVNANATHQIWCKQYIYPSWRGWYSCGPY